MDSTWCTEWSCGSDTEVRRRVSKHPIHDQIDATIHQRTRLAIMVSLAAVESMGFDEVKAQLQLTDGNLSTHVASLEKAGYVKVTKSFKGKKTHTAFAVTAKGRKALTSYLDLLERMIDQARGDAGG